MQNVTLLQFIEGHRDELIGRCRTKVEARSAPPSTEYELNHGVPLFLNQLCDQLRDGPSETNEIRKSAKEHGHDLLRHGFTISQVVHDYGDVCQSVTELAMELSAPIRTDDFRTMNRCLDDAIAGAVTEYSLAQDLARDGESHEIRSLIASALTAFEVLQTGHVGVGGSTGAVILRSLNGISAAIDRQSAEIAQTVTGKASE